MIALSATEATSQGKLACDWRRAVIKRPVPPLATLLGWRGREVRVFSLLDSSLAPRAFLFGWHDPEQIKKARVEACGGSRACHQTRKELPHFLSRGTCTKVSITSQKGSRKDFWEPIMLLVSSAQRAPSNWVLFNNFIWMFSSFLNWIRSDESERHFSAINRKFNWKFQCYFT